MLAEQADRAVAIPVETRLLIPLICCVFQLRGGVQIIASDDFELLHSSVTAHGETVRCRIKVTPTRGSGTLRRDQRSVTAAFPPDQQRSAEQDTSIQLPSTGAPRLALRSCRQLPQA